MRQVHCFATPTELMSACADAVSSVLSAAIELQGIARIALSGGSTPAALYAELARRPQALPWSRVRFYFGDERSVPQDHPDSNFRLAKTHLFTPLSIDPAQVFPMVSAPPLSPTAEAARYAALLAEFAAPNGVPVFDLILNGMGDDGHFASLFPGTPALDERSKTVVVNPVERLQTERLTLTFPVFEAARRVLFLVSGASKHAAFTASGQPDSDLPVARLSRARVTDWFIDRACAEGSGQ
ncbi:6-phosphogluconolactonase [Halothiobacillus sp. DCM-1]|uniref:6-phosphogluconolactonase n=1 Tax=Halothiobacillus sp. DCM-1 TaxID=3112558 RepID=UPI00324B982E